MSENNKIRKKLTEFFRYIRNELSGRERNSFERELQKDPFAEEALDGYSTIPETEAIEDLTNLKERISKRTLRKSRSLIYRIAGIVLILFTVSAVLVLTILKKPNNQVAINTAERETFEIKKGQPVIESDSKDNVIYDHVREEKRSIKADDQKITKGAQRRTDSIEKPDMIANDNIVSESRVRSSKEEVPGGLVSAPMARMAQKKSATGYAVTGKVLSAEDNLPIPGATISIKGTKKGAITDMDGNFSINLSDSVRTTLTANYIGMDSEEINASPGSQVEIRLNPSVSALSEVVVTGYGVKKSESGEDELYNHIYPQPATGKLKFNEYVRNNLHRPDNADAGKKAVVVISFLVRISGDIDSIRIIRSPGKEFSDEAIRVITTGPEWKPAEENGKPVEEDVRLRIVFR